MTTSIKDMVKDGKKVKFVYFRMDKGGGSLWYETETFFRFPVPISDVGEATFFAEDKAILFMRYIRKEIESQKEPPLSDLPITL